MACQYCDNIHRAYIKNKEERKGVTTVAKRLTRDVLVGAMLLKDKHETMISDDNKDKAGAQTKHFLPPPQKKKKKKILWPEKGSVGQLIFVSK